MAAYDLDKPVLQQFFDVDTRFAAVRFGASRTPRLAGGDAV